MRNRDYRGSKLEEIAGENVIVVPIRLTALGIYKAIFISQLDYWMRRSNKQFFGDKWVYNTFHSWAVQFPFMSEMTIKRIVKDLSEKGIIKSSFFGKPMDRTKWYTIDYERLEEVLKTAKELEAKKFIAEAAAEEELDAKKS